MKKFAFFLIIVIFGQNLAFPENLTPADYNRLYSEAVAKQDYTEAFNVAQRYLEAHQITDACFLLGHCYYLGIGTEQNIEYTKELFKAVYESPNIDVNSPLALRQEYAYCTREYAGLRLMSLNPSSLTKEDFKPYFKAIEICNDPYSLFFIGYAYWLNLLPGGSEDLYMQYLNRAADQNCIAALSLLGIIYDEKGDEDTASMYYSKAVSIPLFRMEYSKGTELFTNPNHGTNPLVQQLRNLALFNYGVSLFDLRLHQEAAALANQITDNSNIKFSNFISSANISVHNYQTAYEWANNSISIDPTDSQAHFLKGLSLYGLERVEECNSSIKMAITLGSAEAENFYNKYLVK